MFKIRAKDCSALTGQAMHLERLPHLWEMAIVCKQLVLLGPHTQRGIHVLVAQPISSISVNEIHARESALILNAAMALLAHPHCECG